MNLVDVLNQIWTQILTVTAVFVTPDWGVIIGWLPVIVLLGLVMPFLTFLALGSLLYVARKPRTKVVFEEGPRLAEIGPGGEPVFPVGLPHCRRPEPSAARWTMTSWRSSVRCAGSAGPRSSTPAPTAAWS